MNTHVFVHTSMRRYSMHALASFSSSSISSNQAVVTTIVDTPQLPQEDV
jgi:hypothetical protein